MTVDEARKVLTAAASGISPTIWTVGFGPSATNIEAAIRAVVLDEIVRSARRARTAASDLRA
jgi:hypothetical protein